MRERDAVGSSTATRGATRRLPACTASFESLRVGKELRRQELLFGHRLVREGDQLRSSTGYKSTPRMQAR